MVGRSHLTVQSKLAIMRAHGRGVSDEELAAQYRVHRTTISRVIENVKTRGHALEAPGRGRPRKTSNRVDRQIQNRSRECPRKNAKQLAYEFQEDLGVDISPKTVKRRLKEAGLTARRPARKPHISAKNRAARLDYALKFKDWTIEQWKRVLFSDESKYNLFGNDSRGHVYRPDGERFNEKYIVPTMKHGGGNVMVWSCFHADGVGPLVRITDKMDRFIYKDILEQHMLRSSEHATTLVLARGQRSQAHIEAGAGLAEREETQANSSSSAKPRSQSH